MSPPSPPWPAAAAPAAGTRRHQQQAWALGRRRPPQRLHLRLLARLRPPLPPRELRLELELLLLPQRRAHPPHLPPQRQLPWQPQWRRQRAASAAAGPASLRHPWPPLAAPRAATDTGTHLLLQAGQLRVWPAAEAAAGPPQGLRQVQEVAEGQGGRGLRQGSTGAAAAPAAVLPRAVALESLLVAAAPEGAAAAEGALLVAPRVQAQGLPTPVAVEEAAVAGAGRDPAPAAGPQGAEVAVTTAEVGAAALTTAEVAADEEVAAAEAVAAAPAVAGVAVAVDSVGSCGSAPINPQASCSAPLLS